MNQFLKKTAAFIAAGLMATASLGAECFAESAKLTQSYVDLKLDAAVAKPTFTVKGTRGVRKIRLSTTSTGATIYYTTNGAVPTTKSKVYTGSLIKITSDTKIKAIAVKGGVSSPVMTKTFYVDTMYGDVTGDHQINSNDYSRLKNYIAGKTTYICKDNADCNGSGGISSADLTVLGKYLNGSITSLPSKSSSSVKKPTATMKKIYGGMQITLKPTVTGSAIYYTTNGSIPTTSSTRYTSPFNVTETSTVKAISYLNGESSGVFSFNVDVGTLSEVQADKPTSSSYTGELSVTLYNSNSSARIIYTTDGSDPRTSYSASIYISPIKISKTTTIKAYAQAKSYTDSPVATFNYNVDAAYTISGTVWDDSVGKVGAVWDEKAIVTSNGVMASNESGISGIPVYLINSTTAAQDAPSYYVQKTTTDSYGRYSFSNLSSSISYKVVFEYNCQKYRAYNSIVSGGNQALPYKTVDPVTVRQNGAYSVISSLNETFLNSVVKYSDAINSSYYKMYAITSKTYTESASDVNCALVSHNYGVIDLSVSVSGYDTSNNTIKNGKTVSYTITVTNNSPMQLTTLDSCTVEIFFSNTFSEGPNWQQQTASNYVNPILYPSGYLVYTWGDFVGNNGLAPGKSAKIQFDAVVGADIGEKVECYAQVKSYKFGTNCYDYYSVPGNMTVGKPKERDEAGATVLTVGTGSGGGTTPTTTKKLTVDEHSRTILNGSTYTYEFYITNGTSINDVFISSNDTTVATYSSDYKKVGDIVIIKLTVRAESPGTSNIVVTLKDDTRQSVTFTTTVNPIVY